MNRFPSTSAASIIFPQQSWIKWHGNEKVTVRITISKTNKALMNKQPPQTPSSSKRENKSLSFLYKEDRSRSKHKKSFFFFSVEKTRQTTRSRVFNPWEPNKSQGKHPYSETLKVTGVSPACRFKTYRKNRGETNPERRKRRVRWKEAWREEKIEIS